MPCVGLLLLLLVLPCSFCRFLERKTVLPIQCAGNKRSRFVGGVCYKVASELVCL